MVEAGSIAGGARSLGLSAAAVSQNIARLEAHLQVRLLARTTRSMVLTPSGSLYYDKVKHIERDLEQAQQAVTAPDCEPKGRLCIASSSAFGRHVLAPLIPAFSARYPQLSIELVTNDRRVNHAQEGVDVSIRIQPQLEDGLLARHIAGCRSFVALPRAIWRRPVGRNRPSSSRNTAAWCSATRWTGAFCAGALSARGCVLMPSSTRC